MSFRAIPHEDEIYRFGSVDALIGTQKELYRQTCYLARPDQLNDVAEDTANVVWKGDAILWPNLIFYYWRSLAVSLQTGYVFLPGYHGLVGVDYGRGQNPTLRILPTDSRRQMAVTGAW